MRAVSLLVLLALMSVGCKDSLDPKGETPSGQKNVVMLRYKAGSESTEKREQGFLETIQKEFPGITVLSSDQYADTTPEKSLAKAMDVLNAHGDKVHGFFAVCEPNANGVLQALENTGQAGQVKFIAFDPSPELVSALESEKVHGIVLQDPFTMGKTAVEVLLRRLNDPDAQIEKRIPTGEFVATKANMHGKDENGHDINLLLHPEQFEGGGGPANARYELAVIPKGTTHEFWKSVHAGASAAAKELGDVGILWNGPLNENDTQEQIAIVRSMIDRKVDGICLAPNDSGSLVDAVKEAVAAGIPVVIFDSGLACDESVYVSYVATDNYRGGALAARELAKALGVEPGKP